MDGFLQDLRFAARTLLRSPGFSAAAILALGLGIGASTAVFSVLDGIVLRPLPYEDPSRLVVLWDSNPGQGLAREPVSPVNFLDDRALSVFEDAAGWWRPNLNLTDGGRDPLRVPAIEVSANFFSVLGVRPALGAGFSSTPFYVRGDPAVVISDRLWRTRYNADQQIVGRSVQLNGQLHTVTGVAPAGFDFPPGIDVYQRLNWDFAQHSRAAHFVETIARLKPGVTLEAANTELSALATRLQGEFSSTNKGWTVFAVPLSHEVAGFFRVALLALLGAVALLLVVACINVANLLLARATVREREVALRAAIGASRSRLVKQLLTESLLLAILGAGLGVVCAAIGVKLFVRFPPLDIPRLAEVAINGRALLFACGVTLSTVLLFGTLPAFLLARTDLDAALKTGARSGAGRGGVYLRRALVAAEVGLAVILLMASGLLVRTVQRLVHENPGFNPTSVVTANLDLPERQYRDWQAVGRFYADVGRALREEGGVTAAGLTNVLPLAPGWRVPFLIDGRPRPRQEDAPNAQHESVDEEYFQTLGVQLLKGRWLTERDGPEAAGAVLINESLARVYWPGEDPLGRTIVSFARQIGPLGRALIASSRYEIVGVVADVKNASLRNTTEPSIFYSQRQFPFRGMHIVVRGSGTVAALASTMREVVGRFDPGLPLANIRTLDAVIGDTIDRPRVLTTVMTGFAVLALALSALGIYGVLAYAVNQRRQELGVRIALGAGSPSIVWLVLRQGLVLVTIGVVVGALGSVVLGRFLSGLLFGVTPTDPVTFGAVLGVIAAVSFVSCALPARRAAGTDVLGALRGD
jgi:putative ABC transport system permease protein